ncbi:MAG: ribosome maturation factor RimP [Desulfobacterales bacterium]|jgi:ribosome maturation factor RimP|nr:MAG: ribosome maturation factor RimP [Desulfobacterales bacterium]
MKVERAKNKFKKKSQKRTQTVSPKNEQSIIAQAAALAEPVCDSEGIELVHIEYQREPGGWILRLYIDKPGGVTLDDCVNVSHQMNDLLDVYLDDIAPYNLEVTSPGLDRPLAKRQDFEKFKGNLVKIKTVRPFDGQKNFSGVLMGISGEQVKLMVGEETVNISLNDISKARLVNFSGEI